MSNLNRRMFLKSVGLVSASAIFPLSRICLADQDALSAQSTENSLRFGIITDLHQDVMHDGIHRLKTFIDGMNSVKADFIIHLGDFCQPQPQNLPLLKQYNQFKGPRYHVLGNHDMDGGFKREQTVDYYKMPGRYYSFDLKGVHFVVLDGNDPGGTSSGYARYIGTDQIAWLRKDLDNTDLPTVLFSHQPLDPIAGIENHGQIRAVLEQINLKAGRRKVAACFAGHSHLDIVKRINDILYTQINSASYYWMPSEFIHESYPSEIHQEHPWIKHTCPYKDPLWAEIEIDTQNDYLKITGRQTQWVGPSPWKLGLNPKKNAGYLKPAITNWKVPF